MDKQIFMDTLFSKGREAGFEEMEVYISGDDKLEIMIFKGEVNKYAISGEEGLSFRGLYKGKMGYAYTEKLDEDALNMLIESARDNAMILDHDDEEHIHGAGDSYTEIETYNPSCEDLTGEDKIALAKTMEEWAYKADERVDVINYCLFESEVSSLQIRNSKELDVNRKSNIFIAYISVVVKEGDDVQTGAFYKITNDYHKMDVKKIAEKAVEIAVSKLGADSIESGKYPVILKNDASASILKAFSPMFSADNVHKRLSLLMDKLGDSISSNLITIVDDPHMQDGTNSSAFDAEGVATSYKKVVDQGILTTYLHNLKTAHKDGVPSTGNATRSSYKGAVDIAPSNLYIMKGEKSYNDLIEDLGSGIIIDDVQGLHAGINTISGDFSLSASGQLVENGVITRPINQITIAGNYIELLKSVEDIGTDLEFALPTLMNIGSPSLRVKELSIGGK